MTEGATTVLVVRDAAAGENVATALERALAAEARVARLVTALRTARMFVEDEKDIMLDAFGLTGQPDAQARYEALSPDDRACLDEMNKSLTEIDTALTDAEER